MINPESHRTCPVCGYSPLESPPRDSTGAASFEICPCCSFQFGVTDDDRGQSYAQWRRSWVAAGMPWDRGSTSPPLNWDPVAQLQRAIRIEKS